MLDPDEIDKAGVPLTARAVFVIGPDKKLKLSILYPATTGRNFVEVGVAVAACCMCFGCAMYCLLDVSSLPLRAVAWQQHADVLQHCACMRRAHGRPRSLLLLSAVQLPARLLVLQQMPGRPLPECAMLLQILRAIDSLQLTANHSVATPVNWQHGDKCMVVPTLSDDDANKKVSVIP